MPAADWEAIADALVAKFAGISGVVKATRDELDGVTTTPAVQVLPAPSIRTVNRAGMTVWKEARYPCDLLVGVPAGAGRALDQLYPYIASVDAAFLTGMGLGLSYVYDTVIEDRELGDRGPHLACRFTVVVKTVEIEVRSIS